MRQLPAGADSISGSSTAEVAVGFDPCDRAVEALPVILVRLGELSRETGELQLLLIDLLAAADQLNSDLFAGPGYNSPTPLSIMRLYEQMFGVSTKGSVNFCRSTTRYICQPPGPYPDSFFPVLLRVRWR